MEVIFEMRVLKKFSFVCGFVGTILWKKIKLKDYFQN